MSRAEVLFTGIAFVGLVLVLSTLPWFAGRSLEQRLRPHVPGAATRRSPAGMLSVGSFREVVAPMANVLGTRLAKACGVHDDLATRLRRAHATTDPTRFRLRQAAWAFGSLLAASALVLAVRAPVLVAALFVLGAPVLAFLVLEQQLGRECATRQRRTFVELPVVSEQLAMLLGAGYSLAGALARVAERGNGACAADLARVCDRMRQGLGEREALLEWADTIDVSSVHRLVAVLALNRQAADLGRLISEEARSVRRDAQRELIESIERRTQMVWIPVTVAALVPGVIFMAVPFVQALSLFSGS
jgi:tight adherence protein C